MRKLLQHEELDTSYDGLSCPRAFRRTFMKLAAMFSWNDSASLGNMEHYLEGKALAVYTRIMTTKPQAIPPYVAPTTTASFFDAFLIACAQPTSNLLNIFNNRTPLPGESIAKYLSVLRELFTKASPGLSEQQRTPFLRNRLRTSMPENLQMHMDFNDHLDLDELADKLDNVSSLVRQRFFPNIIPSCPRAHEIETNYVATQRQGPVQSASRSQFDGECYYCEKYGHMERDCYMRKRDERNDRNGGCNDDRKNSRQAEFESESFTVTASLSTARSSTLPHVQADLCILKGSTIRALVLVDSGSTHSFIAPHVLGKQDLMLLDRNPDFFNRQTLSLKGVNGLSKSAACVLAEATVKIGEWSGKHTFIVTNAMDSQHAILGFDFMRKHNVTLSYGSNGMDKMKIENVEIGVSNTMTTMLTTPESVQHISSSAVNLPPNMLQSQTCLPVPCMQQLTVPDAANNDYMSYMWLASLLYQPSTILLHSNNSSNSSAFVPPFTSTELESSKLESENNLALDELDSHDQSVFSVSLNNTLVLSSLQHTSHSPQSSNVPSPLPDEPPDPTTVLIDVTDDAIGSPRVLQSSAKLKTSARLTRAVKVNSCSRRKYRSHADSFEKVNSYAYERPFIIT
jgi:hypothetical protein